MRLLRLLQRSDKHSRIECQLITCPLIHSGSPHPFEALSYRWGSDDDQKPVYIDGYEVPVNRNLYAALSRLQDRFIERIIWVDAICIDQKNDDEKGSQIQLMAKIFSKATRVLVWLGKERDNSDTAFKKIHQLVANDEPINSFLNVEAQEAISMLLKRRWFQRIWVIKYMTNPILRNG